MLEAPHIKFANEKRETLRQIANKAKAYGDNLAKDADVDAEKLALWMAGDGPLGIEEMERVSSTLYPGFVFDGESLVVGKPRKREKIAMTLPQSFTGEEIPQNVNL